jgi:alpha(1,3/1,4) fucosyltransferase
VGESWVPRPLRNLGFRLERQWDRLRPGRKPLLQAARRVYRGPVASTGETLARYTFSICFENMVMEGWVTEKPFDCLRAGCIPIYLGAPDIERWLWPECFVDMREFGSYDELRAFLRDLSPDQVQGYRDAGREYFSSDQFRPFTKEAFAELFEEIVREDAGVEL